MRICTLFFCDGKSLKPKRKNKLLPPDYTSPDGKYGLKTLERLTGCYGVIKKAIPSGLGSNHI